MLKCCNVVMLQFSFSLVLNNFIVVKNKVFTLTTKGWSQKQKNCLSRAFSYEALQYFFTICYGMFEGVLSAQLTGAPKNQGGHQTSSAILWPLAAILDSASGMAMLMLSECPWHH